jgi:hypothetical protein
MPLLSSRHHLPRWSAGLLVLWLVASPADGQSSARPTVSLSTGAMQFDLSGTGTALMAVARGEIPISRIMLLEGSLAYSRPEQQFSGHTSLLIPEVQAHLQWPLGRVAPYLGAGGGLAMDFRGEDFGGLETAVTLSGAGGLRVRFSHRLGARAELRVRGVGTEFSGVAAEWTLGASWRL